MSVLCFCLSFFWVFCKPVGRILRQEGEPERPDFLGDFFCGIRVCGIDFYLRFMYDGTMVCETDGGARSMKKKSKFGIVVGLLTLIAAAVAAVAGVLIYTDKKKEEEDLEHYLDCSIQ